jgi:hypothetical protein
MEEELWLFRIFGGLWGRLFLPIASASHGVRSKEDGKGLTGSSRPCGLGLDTSMDAQAVMEEIVRRKGNP